MKYTTNHSALMAVSYNDPFAVLCDQTGPNVQVVEPYIAAPPPFATSDMVSSSWVDAVASSPVVRDGR